MVSVVCITNEARPRICQTSPALARSPIVVVTPAQHSSLSSKTKSQAWVRLSRKEACCEMAQVSSSMRFGSAFVSGVVATRLGRSRAAEAGIYFAGADNSVQCRGASCVFERFCARHHRCYVAQALHSNVTGGRLAVPIVSKPLTEASENSVDSWVRDIVFARGGLFATGEQASGMLAAR